MLFYRKTIILLILLCAGLFFSSCEYENKDDEISAAYDKIIAKTQNSSSEEEPEYPNDLYPECTYPPSFPCLDSSSGLVWTFKSPDKMTWKEAYSYCTRLNEGGYNDWRMPNIDELRTLIQNHPGTQTASPIPSQTISASSLPLELLLSSPHAARRNIAAMDPIRAEPFQRDFFVVTALRVLIFHPWNKKSLLP